MVIKRLAARLAFALIAVPLPASAFLGGEVASVEADRAWIGGVARTVAGNGYVVYEIRSPSTTIVREYVSPEGRVFAIAWEGPALPDLRRVLGSYFEQFVASGTQGEAVCPDRWDGSGGGWRLWVWRRSKGEFSPAEIMDFSTGSVYCSAFPSWKTRRVHVPSAALMLTE